MPETGPATADSTPSIAFVSSYGGSGGSEVYLERVIAKTTPSSVRSIVSLGAGRLVDRLHDLGYGVSVIPTSGKPLSFLRAAQRLRPHLVELRPDVVHANGLKAAIVSVLASFGTGLPVVWVRHDFSWEGTRARLLARRCTRVVCVSRALTRTFPRSMARKIDVVYTGIPEPQIDRDEARMRVLRDIGEANANPLISLVGRMVPGKGHPELIEIATRLFEEVPELRMLFVGDMPPARLTGYVDRLHRRIDDLGLNRAIRFLGHRDDALWIIAASDIIVVPSVSMHRGIETEGFPLLALEAMAVGTPVVAYAVGGLRELLAGCGELVPSGDRDGLLRGIRRLITDRLEWERASHCGRSRARASFSEAEMVRSLQRVYRSAKR